MTKEIKLALSGSGVLFYCTVGSVLALVDHGFKIIEVSGTSGGGIVAAALATGYAPRDLVKFAKDLNPSKHKAINPSLINLALHWGLIKGDRIEELFGQKFCHTFKETKIPLTIIASNIQNHSKEIFSSILTPNYSLKKAVRASMSVPLIFAPVREGDKYLIDGGLVSNFPIDVFKGGNIIGVRFTPDNIKKKIGNILDFAEGIASTIIESNMSESIEDLSSNIAGIVQIQTSFSSFDFNITDVKIDKMVEEGYKSTSIWLKSKEYEKAFSKI